MPAFAYDAVDGSGTRTRGRADAANAQSLARTLEDQGLLVLDVAAASGTERNWRFGFRFGQRREVLEVTRALASLLPAGLPLPRAIGAATNVASGAVAEALIAIRERVEHGDSLATALAFHPDLFSPVYVGLVRAGEKSGELDQAFSRLSAQLERDELLRSRLLSASIYPMLLGLLGGLAIVVLMLFVIPRFAELLDGNDTPLPRSTAILLSVSSVMRVYWPLLLAAPFLLAGGVAWLLSTDDGRRLTTTLALHVPLIRLLKQTTFAAQFARILGTLVSGGAPVVTALEDTASSLGDPVVREETVRIRARVREGCSLQHAIAEGTLFPPLLGQLIGVGEESGRLPDFILKAAEIFEDRTDRIMQRAVTLVEPAMIVVFGGIVAMVALSLLQAIYSANPGTIR